MALIIQRLCMNILNSHEHLQSLQVIANYSLIIMFYSKVRFIKIAQTRMLCAPPNKENDILSALAKVTTYKIENNTLILSNPDEQLLVLTKT